LIGFGAMDWSEATYFGLNPANLQDAAGSFVGPSEQSIDAALADATVGPDGVLQYNYGDTTDSSAYAMPLVTYALVSTAAQSAASSQEEGDLLTNLVCYSHSGGSIALPPGYVPLPDNLYSSAIKQISSAFPYTESGCDGSVPTLPAGSGSGHTGSGHTGGAPTGGGHSGSGNGGGGGGGGGNTPYPGGGSQPNPGSNPSSGSTGQTGSTGSGLSTHGHSATKPKGGTGSPPPGTQSPVPPPKSFEPTIIALAEGTERWLVAGFGGAALLGLLIGPLIVLAPRARRRIKTLRGATS
jgi:hypothetical protein